VIRIRKPDLPPQVLLERGAILTAELCRKVDAGEQPNFDSFDRNVYGAPAVKQALRMAQHDKCCFCESKLGHAQFGDVEHYRPKASAQQSPTDPPTTGYYWLAYVWTNLNLSCAICNQRHKRSLFPLANPARRVSSHHRSADLDAEQPLFIDPGSEDPTKLIEFRREYAAPVDGSPRGAATIDALELNRGPLVQRRREHRQPVLAIVILLGKAIRSGLSEEDTPAWAPALEAIVTAAADSGEYTSMIRSLLRQVAPWRETWPPPVAALLEALQTDAANGRLFHVDEISACSG